VKLCTHCKGRIDSKATFCAWCGKPCKIDLEPEDLELEIEFKKANWRTQPGSVCSRCGKKLDSPGAACRICSNRPNFPRNDKPRKRLWPALSLILVLFAIAGFLTNYLLFDNSWMDEGQIDDGWSESNVQEIFNTSGDIEEFINQQYEAGWRDQSISLLANQASALPGVDYTEEGDNYLLVKYEYGGDQLWIFDPPIGESFSAEPNNLLEHDRNVPVIEVLKLSGLATTDNLNVVATASPGNKRAVIINALANDPSYDYMKKDLDRLEFMLNELGFHIDRFDASEADIDRYKALDPYDFIFVTGHGEAGSNREGDWFKIQTGVIYPFQVSEYQKIRDYWSDWRSGYISMMIIKWDPGKDRPEWLEVTATRFYWAVTDRFFEQYSNSLKSSYFVSWSCSSLKNTAMATALKNAGNQLYLGWTDPFGMAPLPVYCVVRQIATGYSLSEAFDALPVQWKTDNRFGNARFTYYPHDAGSFKLDETYSDSILSRLDIYCHDDPGQSALWICDTAGRLGKYDSGTGDVEVIGSMGVFMTDIAFDTAGNLYGICSTSLYSIDPATADTTLIGKHGISGGNALVFGPDGTLYGAGLRGYLYAIDINNGRGTMLGETGYSSSGDLSFNNGNLYLAAKSGFNDILVFIDLETYEGKEIGRIGYNAVYGLDTLDNGLLYGISGTNIIRIRTDNGEGRSVDDYSGQGLGPANGSSVY